MALEHQDVGADPAHDGIQALVRLQVGEREGLVLAEDLGIYIVDVAQGEKIPRKAGQGMIKSDLFVINKTDLGPCGRPWNRPP
jgi:hypothetical protein